MGRPHRLCEVKLPMIQQVPLFSFEPNYAAKRGPTDAASETLLSEFAAARLKSGAHVRSVARDVSQLRGLLRSSLAIGGARTLAALFADLQHVAQALYTPSVPISRSTGHARLLAAQQFIRFLCAVRRQDVTAVLATLDQLLPRMSSSRWHAAGTLVVGSVSRSHRRIPTLTVDDLARLVQAAGEKKRPWRKARDGALMALCCYTGLRTEEITHLEWDQVSRAVIPPGKMSIVIRVQRNSTEVVLPLAKPAALEMEQLANSMGETIGSLSGPVFRAHGESAHVLSYRAARDILRTACQSAGLPIVTAIDLRAACAYWFHLQGWSDHAIANILGLARVRSVDRLLVRHKAIDAQRTVRDKLDR
ncbi:MAG TPA: tyrosine-type recombinase/integrase [Ktedonobacterales bacterium]